MYPWVYMLVFFSSDIQKGYFQITVEEKQSIGHGFVPSFCLDSGTICSLIPETELTLNSLDASIVLSIG